MLLERIEIDTRGPLGLVQLGPFSPGLNAILGPVVHAQAAMSGGVDGLAGLPVVPFLHALMLGSRTPQRTLGGWSGRIVWADAEGLLHCRRELDGTLQGRLAVDFEPREHSSYQLPAASHTSEYLRRRLSQLPPSIVEAVIAEPDGGGSIFATLRAAHRAGLDTVTQRNSLQAEQRREIERLQTHAAQLQQRIEAIAVGDQTIGQLHDRRDQLQAEYESLEQMLRAAREQRQADQTHQRGREQRLLELRDDARRLREQESELRRSLAEIEAALRTITFDPTVEHPRVAVAETHRRQLEDLDGQLIRWRRTLAEVRGMRDQLARVATTGDDDAAVPPRALDDWDARLDAAHRQIDWLTIRYAYGDPLDDEETGAAPEQQPWSEVAAAPANNLTSQLRALKIELAQLGTRLARGAMHDADGSLESARAQLQRCESDLLDSIARLVRQRHRLLRRIAQTHHVPAEQLAAAFGDWSHCQDHPHLYQWLLSEGAPVRSNSREANEARARRLEADRVTCSHELDRTVNRLENCLAEIESLRKVRQQQLTDQLHRWPTERRESVLAELVAVRARLNDLETRQQLIAQRDQLRHQIRQIRPAVRFESTLAHRASHWLARLSGGRLQRIQWDPQGWDPATADTIAYKQSSGDVRIDGRSAAVWSRADQSLATLAVRMAAADALAERGAGIPLLVEVPAATSLTAQPLNHRDAWDIEDHRHAGYRWESSVGGPSWIDTVIAYADSGRQTILLTSDRRIADRVANAGGRVQSLTAHSYALPRSIYTYRSAPQPTARSHQQGLLPQINRDLDMAWREAYGFYDDPAWYRGSHAATDRITASRDGYADDYRDGAYLRSGIAALRPYAPAVNTANAVQAQHQPLMDAEPVVLPAADDRLDSAPGSPFFLTTDSPVEQAPSVDAVAAARLRSLRVTRVGHLLTADPIRLAETLGMPDVSPAAIRRWQHEARLVCQVPQLRGFDARLLVGCGITDPQQLAAMHPGQLLEKVEAFLATDRGRQILRSGSSYELSRITSWIAAANRSVARSNRHGQRPITPSRPGARQADDRHSDDRTADVGNGGDRARDSQPSRRRRQDHGPKAAARRSVVPIAAAAATSTVQPRRNFYLDRHSPIVDAPSIGPRTASRLQQVGVHTVADLLQEDAARLAERLGSKRIDAKTVRAWQQQATLMCRVPMLRGYEAALLVAADIHKPERLASWDADQLLSKIRKLVGTAEGKRILRGANEPDLQKVAAWIRNAQHHRALHAA